MTLFFADVTGGLTGFLHGGTLINTLLFSGKETVINWVVMTKTGACSTQNVMKT